jgi:hypothetical protein
VMVTSALLEDGGRCDGTEQGAQPRQTPDGLTPDGVDGARQELGGGRLAQVLGVR